MVANTSWNMSSKLCPDSKTRLIGLAAAIALIAFPFAWLQIMVILAGGICGVLLFRSDSETETQPAAPSASTGNRAATAYIVLFFAEPNGGSLGDLSIAL